MATIYEDGVPREMAPDEAAAFEAARPVLIVWPRLVTSLQFLELFTPAERAGIRAAARAPGGELIDDFLDMQRAAQVVDMDDARTAAGLAALQDADLISAERRSRIATGLPPAD